MKQRVCEIQYSAYVVFIKELLCSKISKADIKRQMIVILNHIIQFILAIRFCDFLLYRPEN